MPIYLSDLCDVAELKRQVAEKAIHAIRHPDEPYTIYSYTQDTFYDGAWTPETRICRGLVVDSATGQIMARPFDRFGSVNEPGQPELRAEVLIQRSDPIEVTEKLDGGLKIIWFDPQREAWRCTTRNAFTGPHQARAEAWLMAHCDTRLWPRNFTVLAEWCDTVDPNVVRYDKPSLNLIGLRTASGWDATYAELQAWQPVIGLPLVARVEAPSLKELFEQAQHVENFEGWVIRYPEGVRVKAKAKQYRYLHKMIWTFSPKHVRDLMLSGEIDLYMDRAPQEIRERAAPVIAAIQHMVQARSAYIAERLRIINAAYPRQQDRKAFGLAVQQEPFADQALLFKLAKGQSIEKDIIERLDVDALGFNTISKRQGQRKAKS